MKEYNGYTMRKIMKCAWKLARSGAKKFGGSVKEYFSESLKTVWALVKKMVYVPTWFINKNKSVTVAGPSSSSYALSRPDDIPIGYVMEHLVL